MKNDSFNFTTLHFELTIAKMGVCLCKDKIDECSADNLPDAYGSRIHSTGTDVDCSLSETVDRLVKETLEVISTIVDKYVLYKYQIFINNL